VVDKDKVDIHYIRGLKPLGAELLSRKNKSWVKSTVDGNTLDNCDELEIGTGSLVIGAGVSADKIFVVIPLFPSTPLNTLLIHIIDVFDRDVVLVNDPLKFREITGNNGSIECLCVAWIKSAGLSKLDFGVTFREEANPRPTRLFGGNIFDNGSDGPLVDRMAGGGKIQYPVFNNLLPIWREKHLCPMCLGVWMREA
jgi:hypothetical protein